MWLMVFCLLGLAIMCFSQEDAILGETQVELYGRDSGKQETVLGNFLTDAVREASGAQAAILSAGAVGEGVPAGAVRQSDVSKLTPYADDVIVVLRLTGKQVLESLERGVRLYPKESLSFLQVSGISFVFNPESKPGERVLRARLGGELVQQSAAYTVATNRFLALGGLGYFKIFNEKNIHETLKTTLAGAITSYLKEKSPVSVQTEDRIKTMEKEEKKEKTP